jgi:ankyrin repeat protein
MQVNHEYVNSRARRGQDDDDWSWQDGPIEIDLPNGARTTPLMSAVMSRRLDLVRLLLGLDADIPTTNPAEVDWQDKAGRTALMFAVTISASMTLVLLQA